MRYTMRYRIRDFKTGERFNDLFVVKSIDIRPGKTGKHFLNIDLADATGQINGKKWELFESEKPFLESLKPGAIVRAEGKITDFNGNLQLNIEKLSPLKEGEEYDRAELYKAAPEDSESMYDYIVGKLNSLEDEDLKKLSLSFYEENKERLMYYPAAMRNHHAEYGGLLYHVKRMMMAGEKMCEVYTNLDRDLLLAGVALHDIEKLNEIISDENGVSPGYTTAGQMLGHLVMGAVVIADKCKELGIDEEKAMMLEHMSLSHHYEPEFGSPKKPVFPEAEMLHYLDMMDAKMYDFKENLDSIEPGEFTDKIFTLDNRRLYKRTF